MSSVFYVAVNGNDSTGVMNNPTRPYTLAGVLTLVATQQPQGVVTVILMPGTYRFECPRQVLISGNLQFFGSSPNDVIIYASNILCTNGKYVTFNNLSLVSCGAQNLINLDHSTLALSNVNVDVQDGTFFTGTDGQLILNNVNLKINAPKTAFIVDGSTCGLNIFNSTIDVRFNYPLTTNVALIGRKTSLGFINIYNVLTNVTLNGGTRSVIAYYNANNVSHSDLTLRGTCVEGVILIGLDIQPPSKAVPFVYVDIQAAIKDVGAVFSMVNVYNYPVIIQDINWIGQNRNPGIYPVQAPPPNTGATTTTPTRTVAPAQGVVNTATPTQVTITPSIPISATGAAPGIPVAQFNQIQNRGYNPTGVSTYDSAPQITDNMLY